MTLQVESNWKLQFEKSNYLPLQLHYNELTRQIHIMAEYAERGIERMADALQLAMDYFSLSREVFCKRWLPGRENELERQTTPQSWESIVETLAKPNQRAIVADDRENTNTLVLAGPGAGKTRVLVHRIAYLVRIRRENPRAIVALAYNRHAALEIRHRLRELIGNDALGVTVLTCHALAMRLVGASFAERQARSDDDFDAILSEATALLEGRGLPPEDADAQRDRLLAGFRWIFVDEYQDIGPAQYALISALAGRKRSDEDGRLNLFARRLPGANPVSGRKLPVDRKHHCHRQRLDRPSWRPDEGKPADPDQRSPQQIVTGRRLAESRQRRARAGANHPGRAQRQTTGDGRADRDRTAARPRARPQPNRRHRPPVEIPRPPAGRLRGTRPAGQHGRRGSATALAPAGNPGSARLCRDPGRAHLVGHSLGLAGRTALRRLVPRSRSTISATGWPSGAAPIGTGKPACCCFPHTAPRGWNSTMSSFWMASGRGRKVRMATPPAASTTSR